MKNVQSAHVKRLLVKVVLGSISSAEEKQALSLLEIISLQKDSQMRFCSLWQSFISNGEGLFEAK